MSEFAISFQLSSKPRTLPIHKVINQKSLVHFQFIIGQKLKQNDQVEFVFENTDESPSKMDPISFELSCKSAEDTFAAIPLQFHVDCSQVDLQLRVNPLFKSPKEKSLPFEIHYKTFDSGGNVADPIPTNEKWDAIPI